MIDTHCHALFNVDDASKTLEQAIAMLKGASKDGVTDVLITPHCVPGEYYENSKELLIPVFETVKKELKKQKVNLNVYLGCELTMTDGALVWLKEKKVQTLNNTDWILIELPWHTPFKSDNSEDDFIRKCFELGYKVLVAHPERYKSVQNDFSTLKRWREMGCCFSVNRTGILSSNPNERALCMRMIKEGYADVVASDAHDSYHRPIELSVCYKLISENFNEETAHRLLIDNPSRILEGKDLV